MRTLRLLIILLVCLAPVQAAGQFRTHNDRFAPPQFTSKADWDRRAAHLREHVLATAGLVPLPAKPPLHAVIFDDVTHADYRVSKVYFESLPGFFVTGNLYRPAGDGPFPAVLSPHGHWTSRPSREQRHHVGPGRAINLARQGFVVFMYDMVGYNDSRQLPHTFGGRRENLWGLSLSGLQLWNGIRSLDFLESLPYVRKDAIGMTGESGGGSQTFLLAAADPRVAVAVPVNMISLHMQGGCLCENTPGLRLDTTNVEIAATIAPRPLLMISATGDWTAETLEAEYPAVRAIYALAGAEDRVSAVRFTAEHNYNKDSRESMYAWMAQWLKGAPAQPRLEEQAFTPERLPDLLVFHGRTLPEGALTPDAFTAAWIEAAQQQLTETSLSVRAAALRHALDVRRRNGSGAGRRVNPDCRPPPSCRAHGRRQRWRRSRSSKGRLYRPAHSFHALRCRGGSQGPALRRVRGTRTAASQRVADIVAALRAEPGAILIAAGDDALAGALASAIDPPRLAMLDVRGFDTTRDEGLPRARVYPRTSACRRFPDRFRHGAR